MKSRGLALVVDDNNTNRMVLRALLEKNGFDILQADNGAKAVDIFKKNKFDIVFMDVLMPEMDGYEATRLIKSICEEKNLFVPVIFLTALTDDDSLSKCIDAGGDDFISKPYNISILNSKIYAMERVRDMSRKIGVMYSQMQSNQELAEKVFSNAVLTDNIDNNEIKCIMKPADIFSGDMFISAYSPSRDINILMADFTGHGLAAAIGALPTSEVFRAMSAKGFALHEIVKTINKKLCDLLPTHMFMACQFICVDRELKNVSVINCGMPPIYVKHEDRITHIESNVIPLGVTSQCEYINHIQYARTSMGDSIILSSDGVTDAMNNQGEEYSDKRLVEALSQNTGPGEFAIDNVYSDLEQFIEGGDHHDDISLAEIRLTPGLLPIWDISSIAEEKASEFEINSAVTGEMSCFEFSLHSCGENIKRIDPIPQIVNNICDIIQTKNHSQSLFTILTELYVNALDHGVLGLDSALKDSPEGFSLYFKKRENLLTELDDGFIHIGIKIKSLGDKHIIVIRVEDSGKGFDLGKVTSILDSANSLRAFGRGIILVNNLCESLHYEQPGNIAEAVYVCNN